MEHRLMRPCGVELVGFDVRSASDNDLRSFEKAFQEYSLVLIRDPQMTPEEQVALLGRLGPVAVEFPGCTEVSYVSYDPANRVLVDEGGGDFGKGELAFHQDMSYMPDWPTWIISLYGERVTKNGGETRFIHTGQVYAKLDEAVKQAISGKRAVHLLDQQKRLFKTRESDCGSYTLRGVHDLVRPHPYGGGNVLTVAETDTDRIVGMRGEEGEKLLQLLFDAMADPEGILDHQWRQGDLLVWDNRVVQHARADFDAAEARVLRRVAVGDGPSTLLMLRNRMEQLHDMVF